MTTTLRIDTTEYNERRYSKPWIARVNFDRTPKGEFIWGDWVGRAGEAGTLVITVNEGDIVASGQKDNRGNNTRCDYYQVRDGKRVKLDSKAAAYKLAIAAPEVA